jgi:hypothetical protein
MIRASVAGVTTHHCLRERPRRAANALRAAAIDAASARCGVCSERYGLLDVAWLGRM